MAGLPSLRQRVAPHTLAEKIDGAVEYETFAACFASLESVNRASFGYLPTVKACLRMAGSAPGRRPLRILDVGSGAGGTMRAVAKAFRRRGISAELTGADLSPHAARAAGELDEEDTGSVSIRHVTRNARDFAVSGDAPDIILCALFTHHLEDGEVVEFLRFMDGASRLGWFVNDLYRSRFAAVSFGLLAKLTGRHPFVQHDGPVSFARSFRRGDWEALLARAGVPGARIFIGAPFRMCVEKVHGRA
ncbi:MAG: methyltransferase domain-containing protein [Pseudomonadota bacterium]